MDQEQAFLEAIRHRPGSAADRLIYADWLTERGDLRGEFIRYQVQARRLSSSNPRRLDLEAQAQDLLLVHEADWLGPMLGHIANWDWRGGLLEWVTLSAEVFLANAEHWLPTLPLLGVHLRKARPHIAALARCPQMRYLNGLYLGDTGLRDADLKVLLGSPYLKRLRTLYLHSNNLRDKGIRFLAKTANLPRLRELGLGHNMIGDEAIAALANSPHLGRLRHLNLMLTGLEEAGVRALAGSPLLSRLRVLSIGMNRLPAGCLAALAAAPGLAGLRVLSYGMNLPDDADVAALAGSPHADGLRHLALDSFSALGDQALTALASSPSLGRLRQLSVGPGLWGRVGVRALGRSRCLTSLRSLKLTPGPLTAREVPRALLGKPLIRHLRCLDLNVDQIDKEALNVLASHPQPLRLRELELTLKDNMAASWVALLARKLLASLTTLTLNNPPPGTLRALLEPGRLPQLRLLNLHGLPDCGELQELLTSPLLGQLHQLRIGLDLDMDNEETAEDEVVRRLITVWNTPVLRHLGLLWSLSLDAVRLLAEAPPPPALAELELGVFELKAEGMAVLAGCPLLRQLRRLGLSNASSQAVPGLEALADSPHVGPLLRVDINNGHVPPEALPAIRRRFGGRFAADGRIWPQTILLGGLHRLLGDGED